MPRFRVTNKAQVVPTDQAAQVTATGSVLGSGVERCGSGGITGEAGGMSLVSFGAIFTAHRRRPGYPIAINPPQHGEGSGIDQPVPGSSVSARSTPVHPTLFLWLHPLTP